MENKERIQGSGNVSKSSLLQQVRGSMVNIEKLTPDNIGKVADEELITSGHGKYSRLRASISIRSS